MNKPTHADDCERLIRILADAPADGLTMDQIHEKTAQNGEVWSHRTINDLLCDLRGQIGHAKVREKGGKVTKYFIKRS